MYHLHTIKIEPNGCVTALRSRYHTRKSVKALWNFIHAHCDADPAIVFADDGKRIFETPVKKRKFNNVAAYLNYLAFNRGRRVNYILGTRAGRWIAIDLHKADWWETLVSFGFDPKGHLVEPGEDELRNYLFETVVHDAAIEQAEKQVFN